MRLDQSADKTTDKQKTNCQMFEFILFFFLPLLSCAVVLPWRLQCWCSLCNTNQRFLLLAVEQKTVLLLLHAVIHATIENQQAVCDSYCCFLKGLFSPSSKSKSFA